MEYKNIFKKQESRLKILKVLKFIPDKWMITIQYWLKLKKIPNLKNPQRFTEKIQWYKLNYRNKLLTIAADKYEVRNYLSNIGQDDLLTELYGVYDEVSEIDINKFPQKFVLKTTNGSGTNIICTDKYKLNIEDMKNTVQTWLDRDMYAAGREWAYKNIKPRIIVEELLEDNENTEKGINDYKFLCFDGQPQFVILDVSRFTGHKRNIYDLSWNLIDVGSDKPNIRKEIPKPDNLDEMVEVAKKLSEDFPFVRVDLYSVNGKIYFGELTFYPWTGYVSFDPDNFDFELGKYFNLKTSES